MNIQAQAILKLGSKLEIGRAASLASPVVAIIASLLIVFFVVWPRFSEVLRLRTLNEQLGMRSRTLEEKALLLQSLDGDLLEQQLVSSEQLLPSDKGVFSLVAQIESAAAASGIILSRVETTPGGIGGAETDKSTSSDRQLTSSESGETSSGKELPKIQVKIGIASDYKSFLQFLTNMFSISRVVSIKDMSIASASSESGQVKSSLTIEAYWQALPTELPSIESPIDKLTDSESARLERVRSTGLVSAPVVPSVPLGRSDLFAPF